MPGREQGRALTGLVVGGRFRLGELIGQGAMAEVYAAVDQNLGRDVAVKVLRAQYAGNDEFLGRFRGEARAAASVSHPNLVNVYDTGDDVGGDGGQGVARPYIVLERLPGDTLADALRGGRLALDTVIDIARQVADGVGFAHRRNLVHRDLKPANILLTADGDAKVADFGLAQDVRDTSVTMAGTVWGTVQYLAPERAEGDPASTASDIYALGIVVYEMLTGSPPFTGGTAASIMQRQVNEAPRPIGEVVPAYRGDVERVVMRALAKSPRDRYESMAAFAGALERLAGIATTVSPTIPQRGDSPRTRVVQTVRGAPARRCLRPTATGSRIRAVP